ncbi:hypothetical protein [Roseibium aggregatum]|uniref:SPOR domain-containing protein n=1 Tax=Roseibium aggregatum TaxID=187304 RepID=A0A926NXH5_9HYPH|nr:hypothetical protein [Roseibium aggregatum]MBD1547124.1 hypothetical protein [Roseibium aggregatum]
MRIKDYSEAISSVATTLLLVLLVAFLTGVFFFPEKLSATVFDRLERAGLKVKELAIAGWKLEVIERDKVIQSNVDDLAIAKAEIERLQKLIPPDMQASNRESADNVANQINTAIRQSEQTVTVTPSQGAAITQWAVVFGADKDKTSALHEIARVKPDYPGAFLAERDGWLRSIVLFPDRANADSAADGISQAVGRTAYVRNFGDWCPGAPANPAPGSIVECGPR